MIVEILTAGIIVGIMGLLIGVVIAVSSKIFKVEVDGRIDIIYKMLPSFNCGSCGTAGCMAFAETLIKGENTIDKCRPCKPESEEKIIKKLNEMI